MMQDFQADGALNNEKSLPHGAEGLKRYAGVTVSLLSKDNQAEFFAEPKE